MPRPTRPDFDGAFHHVMARGNRGDDIFREDIDRVDFLSYLGKVCDRFGWRIYAYCLMDNHYHLLINTPRANLSRGMKELNSYYTRRMNWRYQTFGHLFQGRFKSILVQEDAYLLEVIRYIAMNPVSAGSTKSPQAWKWSSYPAQLNSKVSQRNEPWLEVSKVLELTASGRSQGPRALAEFVTARHEEAIRTRKALDALMETGGAFGSEKFKYKLLSPSAARREKRNAGMREDRRSGLTQAEIAEKWKVGQSMVQRIVSS